MTIYDAVMMGLVIAGVIWGAFRGFTWQIASIGSLVLGYLCSYQVSAYLVPYMAQYLTGDPAIQRGGSMLVAYLAISGAVFLVAWSVRTTLRKMKFEAYDRHLGMLLGGLEGALLGVIGTMFVVSLAPKTREPIFSSPTGHVVALVMDSAGPVLPVQVRNVVTPYWNQVKDSEGEPLVAGDASPTSLGQGPPAEGSPLQEFSQGARTRIGRAMGDAVQAEFERLGTKDDDRNFRHR